MDPTKLLVAGDTHGNSAWFGRLCKIAREQGCDAILQVGDFGYWPHVQGGQKFLRLVTRYCKENDLVVYWIDGNHENFDQLFELPRAEDGFVDVVDRCRYIPRGHRWTWQDVRFGALGGAFSIDWRGRRLGSSWWAQEMPTVSDFLALGDEPLDVLVTHDVPAGVPMDGWPLPDTDQAYTDGVRQLLRRALDATQPKLLLHGHWHRPVRHQLGRTTIVGLASDQEADDTSWTVLDLELPLQCS